ncbi:serine/arginine repetitive matrix protein 1-like isoform X2 [Prinia subflava]|uniref:serine/arginine repetitive matrix protein 1-like isoform X2 n=1 Tax=Prinia subflava TaxID=208062 RepID=UPI002FE1DA21
MPSRPPPHRAGGLLAAVPAPPVCPALRPTPCGPGPRRAAEPRGRRHRPPRSGRHWFVRPPQRLSPSSPPGPSQCSPSPSRLFARPPPRWPRPALLRVGFSGRAQQGWPLLALSLRRAGCRARGRRRRRRHQRSARPPPCRRRNKTTVHVPDKFPGGLSKGWRISTSEGIHGHLSQQRKSPSPQVKWEHGVPWFPASTSPPPSIVLQLRRKYCGLTAGAGTTVLQPELLTLTANS